MEADAVVDEKRLWKYDQPKWYEAMSNELRALATAPKARPWTDLVNESLEDMLRAMRILAANHPPEENGLSANCAGNGDKIEVIYTKTRGSEVTENSSNEEQKQEIPDPWKGVAKSLAGRPTWRGAFETAADWLVEPYPEDIFAPLSPAEIECKSDECD